MVGLGDLDFRNHIAGCGLDETWNARRQGWFLRNGVKLPDDGEVSSEFRVEMFRVLQGLSVYLWSSRTKFLFGALLLHGIVWSLVGVLITVVLGWVSIGWYFLVFAIWMVWVWFSSSMRAMRDSRPLSKVLLVVVAHSVMAEVGKWVGKKNDVIFDVMTAQLRRDEVVDFVFAFRSKVAGTAFDGLILDSMRDDEVDPEGYDVSSFVEVEMAKPENERWGKGFWKAVKDGYIAYCS